MSTQFRAKIREFCECFCGKKGMNRRVFAAMTGVHCCHLSGDRASPISHFSCHSPLASTPDCPDATSAALARWIIERSLHPAGEANLQRITAPKVNSKGQTVKRPENCSSAPQGATAAQCRDGTYSFSKSRRGTCSPWPGRSGLCVEVDGVQILSANSRR